MQYQCVFCDSNMKLIQEHGDFQQFKCNICGSYPTTFTNKHHLPSSILKKRHLISGYIREKNEKGESVELILTISCEKIINSSLLPNDIEQILQKILWYINKKTTYRGEKIDTPPISIGYAKNTSEMNYLLKELSKRGYIEFYEEIYDNNLPILFLKLIYQNVYLLLPENNIL